MSVMQEHAWVANLKRLENLFKESFPNGTSTEFINWICSIYGYDTSK